jgi:hypothetical protein
MISPLKGYKEKTKMLELEIKQWEEELLKRM